MSGEFVVRALRVVEENVQLVAAADPTGGIVVGEHCGLLPAAGSLVALAQPAWPAPVDYDLEALVRLAEYLTAWRAACWMRIQPGSHVEVYGGGWRSRAAVEIARLCGGSARLASDEIAHQGPPPGAILVCGMEHIPLALGRCAERGSIAIVGAKEPPVTADLYPDLHRRGLALRGFHPNPFGAGGWRRDAERLTPLLKRLGDQS
jgi:hypothetical protein